MGILILNRTKGGLDLASWSKAARIGSVNAITGLSRMINQHIEVTTLNIEEVSVRNATGLIGKADDIVVGIYLMFSGNTTGHIMLAFQPDTAFELVDMAMGIPPGSTQTLREMERSVLGELGNVVGSYFLNAVADDAGVCLMPSPPAVVMDMVGAIVGSVMAEVMQENESVFVIRLSFGTAEREIEGRFLVLPTFNSPQAEHGQGEE